jgi:hypothetical protein
MKLMLDIHIPSPEKKISYNDHILLIGSCFTGNVGKSLQEAKFSALHNPTGILFDPLSAIKHLNDYLEKRIYTSADLFHHNELYSSWHHHTEFSYTSETRSLEKINDAVKKGSEFLNKSTWLIVTLGTAYSYQLRENALPVANCHKAPSQWFDKKLLSADEIVTAFSPLLEKLRTNKPQLNVVFTISPVRHVRDGVIENSRSKARLIEAVHSIVERNDQCIYFPAYELVLDVLRDYRFYDVDLVHPNYIATQFVFNTFCDHYLDLKASELAEDVKKIRAAYHHRPMHPDTQQHKQFLRTHLDKARKLQEKLPMLDWKKELSYFGSVK